MAGLGHHSGHDALRKAYGQWLPVRPQRHLVLNTLVTEWADNEAYATSDVVFLLKGERGGPYSSSGAITMSCTATVTPGAFTVGWPSSPTRRTDAQRHRRTKTQKEDWGP